MRLCSEFIPDREKVRTCMLHKRSQLSQACRAAISSGKKERGHYHPHHPRHYRHRS
jgi:hypothetical protein